MPHDGTTFGLRRRQSRDLSKSRGHTKSCLTLSDGKPLTIHEKIPVQADDFGVRFMAYHGIQ